MADPIQDLWPDDIGTLPREKLPVTILREQAAFLGKRTQNRVEAEIVTASDWDTNIIVPGPAFVHRFILSAPMISNYRYELLSVYHPATLYPLKIVFGDYVYDAASVEQLTEHLRRIFSSDTTRTIVGALVAQSAA